MKKLYLIDDLVMNQNRQDIFDTLKLSKQAQERTNSIPLGINIDLAASAMQAQNDTDISKVVDDIHAAYQALSVNSNETIFDHSDLIYATFFANNTTTLGDVDVEAFIQNINTSAGVKAAHDQLSDNSSQQKLQAAIYAGINAARPELILAASTMAESALRSILSLFNCAGQMVIINQSETTFQMYEE